MKSNPTVDPNAAGPGVVAAQEWDLTSSLPQVTANTANASQAATRTAQHRPLTAPRAPTELPGSLRARAVLVDLGFGALDSRHAANRG